MKKRARDIISEVYKKEHLMPTRKEIITFAQANGLDIFDDGESAFMFSDKISLILDLDINNPGEIKKYLIDDGNGNTYEIKKDKIKTHDRPKGFIDIDGKLSKKYPGEIKIKITSNSVYDEVIAIIDGEKINITDWDVV